MNDIIFDGVGGSGSESLVPAMKGHEFKIELRKNEFSYYTEESRKVVVKPSSEHSRRLLRMCWYSLQKIMPKHGGYIDFSFDQINGFLFYDKGYRVWVEGMNKAENYPMPRIPTPFHLKAWVTTRENMIHIVKSIPMSEQKVRDWSRMFTKWS